MERALLTVHRNGLYACAEPDGAISINRLSVDSWEVFGTLDAANAFEIRSAATRRTTPSVPKLRRSPTIPKLLHQVCLTNDAGGGIPKLVPENTEKIRNTNPNFAYRLWTDKDAHDFIYDTYGYSILNRFLRIGSRYGPYRADLFQYLCLYKQGGVYLDLKSVTKRPLSEIILDDDQFLPSQWENGPHGRRHGFGLHPETSFIRRGEYEQWHVIAAAGHPFSGHQVRT